MVGRPGIGTIAYHQITGLLEQELDVVVCSAGVERQLPQTVEVWTTLAAVGIRVPHRLLGVNRAYRYHDLRVAMRLRRSRRKFDLIHCWPRAVLATARAAHARGATVVREAPNTHTAYVFESVSAENELLGLAGPRRHSHNFDSQVLALEEAEYSAADYLLVTSDFARETFIRRGVPVERLISHDYGYEPQRFHPSQLVPRARSGPFTALFVGSCEPRKGLHYALEAWMESGAADGGRFIVCGTFLPEYRRVLEPMLAHPSIEHRGFVADPEAIMESADVLILPSVEEGSALVTYEAQACGCVLLVSSAAGARMENGIHGFIHEPRDVRTLAAQLSRLRSDPELLATMRARVIADAPRLTWSLAGARLREAYFEAAAGHSGNPRR